MRNNQTYPRGPALLTAIHLALSLALMAFFLTFCGCTVSDRQPNEATRRVDVDVEVDVDLNRWPCPDGRCPRRHFGFSILDFGLPHGDDSTRADGLPSNPKSKIQNPKSPSPVVDLPLSARCRNYAGGSCVCASTISLLRWQGRDDLATALRTSCSGGQSAGSLHAHLDRLGVRYATTTSGDLAFLQWAIRTRRGCGITYYPMHYVNLVDLTRDYATLLDNNRVAQYITIPRDDFLRRWRSYGGWATTVVYAPAAPLAKGDRRWALGVGRWAIGVGRWAIGVGKDLVQGNEPALAGLLDLGFSPCLTPNAQRLSPNALLLTTDH